MFPIRISIVLRILFLLAMCCTIATQIASGHMPPSDKGHEWALEPPEVHHQDSRLAGWSSRAARLVLLRPFAKGVEPSGRMAALQVGTLSGTAGVGS